MIYILAIETTGKYASAAIISDEGECCSVQSHSEMNHLKEIIELSDEALKTAGIDKSEITHVAVSVGPGSFTGIRIGVTTARTIAQMLGAECISVSSLEALAYGAKTSASSKACDYVCTVLNARRHQTYAGIWKLSGDAETGMTAAYEEKQYMIEDICDIVRELDGRTVFTGDGVLAYEDILRERLGEELEIADESAIYQSAAEVAELALIKAESGETVKYGELMPDYMRLSEAEQRLKDGTLSRRIVSAERV